MDTDELRSKLSPVSADSLIRYNFNAFVLVIYQETGVRLEGEPHALGLDDSPYCRNGLEIAM